jgi:hypothetical protein
MPSNPITCAYFYKISPACSVFISLDRSVKSPYTISLPMQIRLCTWRGMRRLYGDMGGFYGAIIGNIVLSLILGLSSNQFLCLTDSELSMPPPGSVFYNLPDDTSSFYSRSVLLFFAVLMNTFSSALEASAYLHITLQRHLTLVNYRSSRCTLNVPSLRSIENLLSTIP